MPGLLPSARGPLGGLRAVRGPWVTRSALTDGMQQSRTVPTGKGCSHASPIAAHASAGEGTREKAFPDQKTQITEMQGGK